MAAADSPVLDPGALGRLRRLGGDALARRMIDLFAQNAPERVAAARAALAAGDRRAVERAAHSLRSSAGTLGAHHLQAAAQRLESLAESGAGELGPALAELEAAHAAALTHLLAEKDALPA